MLNRYARAVFAPVMTPVARLLLRAGILPDLVTLLGTLGVCVGALAFFPRGELFWGTMVCTAFVFSDMIDGTMARLSGRSSTWGAFLDSSLDRVGDGAVIGGLLLYGYNTHDDAITGLALWCLVMGGVVSYVKARAEGLGMRADVGIAERSERLLITLVGAGFAGLGVPYALVVALWLVAVGSVITVLQRVALVHRQAGQQRPPANAVDA